MFESVILAVALLGQTHVCPPQVVIGPPIYIDYNLDGMWERSKVWTFVPYRDGTRKRVPVINGYVPRVTYTHCSDGSEHYHYDYSGRFLYEEIMRRTTQPRVKPSPPPLPPRNPELPPVLPRPIDPEEEPRSPRNLAPRNPELPTPSPTLPTPTFAPPEEWRPSVSAPLNLTPIKPTAPTIVPSPADPYMRNPSNIQEPRVRISPSYK